MGSGRARGLRNHHQGAVCVCRGQGHSAKHTGKRHRAASMSDGVVGSPEGFMQRLDFLGGVSGRVLCYR